MPATRLGCLHHPTWWMSGKGSELGGEKRALHFEPVLSDHIQRVQQDLRMLVQKAHAERGPPDVMKLLKSNNLLSVCHSQT